MRKHEEYHHTKEKRNDKDQLIKGRSFVLYRKIQDIWKGTSKSLIRKEMKRLDKISFQ